MTQTNDRLPDVLSFAQVTTAGSRRPRLLYVVNDTVFFVSHRLALAVEAQKSGYEVHVAAMDTGGVEALRKHHIDHHPLRVDRTGINPIRDVDLLLQICRVVRRVRPALMHTVTIKPVLYGGLVARCLGVPALVSAVTGLGSLFGESGAHQQIARAGALRLYRAALGHRNSRTIFQNPDDEKFFVDLRLLAPERALLIRSSGVDVRHFHPTAELAGPPLILLPARLLWAKGIREFVEAARIVRVTEPAVRFALVGDLVAHNRAAVPRATIEAWVAEGAVEWWGYCDDMPEVYAKSHIVCLPSYYREGLPKALIEAAACQRAIVTTDTPGCREVVRSGESGLLVKPRSAQALADALLRLIRDREQRLAMGRRARATAVAEFSIERVVEQTLAIYSELAPATPRLEAKAVAAGGEHGGA